jgi:malate dehydrogenase (oxaloacetate-decarboxylating)
MDIFAHSLSEHERFGGKLSTQSRVPLRSQDDLSTYYSPWVAAPCLAIAQDPSKAYTYTWKKNSVAVVSDGSAVLGLGNIGWLASLPVMEGKAILMKQFADIDAVPIVLNTQNPDEIIQIVQSIAPTFGAINLEDIAAPHCFMIEERLHELVDIPVFHDDQHGTAIVVLAWLYTSLSLVNKPLWSSKIVISGAWAAGIALAKLLVEAWATHIVITDSQWILSHQRTDLNTYKQDLVRYNKDHSSWSIADALVWADVYIGVSQPNIVTSAMIKTMNHHPIVFALSNPHPEITRTDALAGGAYIYASWRSDFPNQINNVLVFPWLLKAALLWRRPSITTLHKLHAAQVLSAYISSPSREKIIPSVFDDNIAWYLTQQLLDFSQ